MVVCVCVLVLVVLLQQQASCAGFKLKFKSKEFSMSPESQSSGCFFPPRAQTRRRSAPPKLLSAADVPDGGLPRAPPLRTSM